MVESVADAGQRTRASHGVKAYPNLWMLDPQGKVASHHVGYGEDSLQGLIAEIKRAC